MKITTNHQAKEQTMTDTQTNTALQFNAFRTELAELVSKGVLVERHQDMINLIDTCDPSDLEHSRVSTGWLYIWKKKPPLTDDVFCTKYVTGTDHYFYVDKKHTVSWYSANGDSFYGKQAITDAYLMTGDQIYALLSAPKSQTYLVSLGVEP